MTRYPEWWGQLHEAALQSLSGETWKRLREFTDRPEVARDLLSLSLIEVRLERRGRGLVALYKLLPETV